MTFLKVELPQLKANIINMMYLVRSQFKKGHEAIQNFNTDLAMSIVATEKTVNATEIKIDTDVENFLALYSPVAIDLRFVMAVFNINSTLERIGDHAEAIARYILDFEKPLSNEVKDKLRFDEMYSLSIEMLNNIIEAFEKEDTTLARNVFTKDKKIDEIKDASVQVVVDLIKADINSAEQLIQLYSIIIKIERVGDLIKNIAEELIFYTEAKILKHKKLKKKIV